MNKLFLLVVLLSILCLVAPASVGAVEDPVSVSGSLFYMDFETGGSAVLSITVSNTSGEDLTVSISDWSKYTLPTGGSEWIDPSWVTVIQPASQLLISRGQMVANVQYTLPDDAPELRYETWIKVDVGGWEKPITVIIRKGSAVPTYEYSVSPYYYKLLVYGPQASIVVDDSEDKEAPPIAVSSKCNGTTSFYISAESPGQDIVISEDSSIRHTDEEIGTIYKQVSGDVAQKWFSTPYTIDNPLPVGPFSKGFATWSLTIPDSVKNGYYSLAVRISPAESTGSMTVDYTIWMLLDVERGQGSNRTAIWIGIGTAILIAVCGTILMKKLRRKNKPVTKTD